MTRRLVAAALIAGLGLTAAPALASHDQHDDGDLICVGGDDRNNPGRMIGYCVSNPLEIIRGR
jgi:hypothetical protein